jgi:hypothetical protein
MERKSEHGCTFPGNFPALSSDPMLVRTGTKKYPQVISLLSIG